MKINRFAAAASIAAVAAPSAFAQDAVQWRVEDGGNGHWYMFVPSISTWVESQVFAESIGAHLVSLTSATEQAASFALTGFSQTQAVWIGLRQDLTSGNYSEPAGGWMWVTGEALGYAAWTYNSPNNFGEEHVGEWTSSWGGGWNDLPATWTRPSIIEWSADCNGDGIVDYGQILDGTFADTNENGVPDCCDEGVSCDPCPGDVNFDGIVNGADISVTLGFWGLNGKPVAADINGDGIVNGADLALVLGNWGPCP